MTITLPDEAYARILKSTGEETPVGGYIHSESTELKWAVIWLIKEGTSPLTEKLRLKVYAKEDFTHLLFSSDWASVSDISGFNDNDHWHGRLRFDFNRDHIIFGETYYVAVETQNYTRNADTFYLGLLLDWKEYVYATDADNISSGKILFYGYRHAWDWDIANGYSAS